MNRITRQPVPVCDVYKPLYQKDFLFSYTVLCFPDLINKSGFGFDCLWEKLLLRSRGRKQAMCHIYYLRHKQGEWVYVLGGNYRL